MQEIQDLLQMLMAALAAVAEQFVTVWLPIQIALIVAGAMIGWVTATLIRKRLDLVALTMGWPASLRLVARALVGHFGAIIFILAILLMRAALAASPLPIGFDLIHVVASLATAWVAVAVLASLIRNQFVQRLVSVVAWTFAALSILGLIEPVRAALDHAGFVIGGCVSPRCWRSRPRC